MPSAPDAFSDDLFLGGRLLLRQPVQGHRLGTDALLLAAAAGAAGRVADLGSGAGLVGLALVRRGAAATALVERDPVFAACAEANVARHAPGSAHVCRADVFNRRDFLADPRLRDQSFDHVATNPPYDQAARGRPSPLPLKTAAHAMQGGALADWLRAGMRLLRDGGTLTLVHRADRLAEVLAALPGRAGSVRVRPVHPSPEAAATRILVRATAGARGALGLLPAFVLHGPDGAFTAEARRVHEGNSIIAMD